MSPHVQTALAKKKFSVPVRDIRNHSNTAPAPPDAVIEKSLIGTVLRDYQIAAVQAIFDSTRGIVQAPTGSGKTKIAVAAMNWAIRTKGLKTLLLTHKQELLYQTEKSLRESTGIEAAIFGDGESPLMKPANIGMIQTLSGRLAKKDPAVLHLLNNVDMLIIDEAHHGDTASFQAVCNACDAFYRIGLTATPMMKGEIEDMQLMAVTGGVIFRITLQELIDRGLLAQPFIKFVRVSETQAAMKRSMTWQSAYRDGVVENPHRNALIIAETADLVRKGCQVLVLVNEIRHGEILQKAFIDGGFRSTYIHGKKDIETRQKALADIQNGNLDILVSSTITDEGVDIPALSAIVLAGGWMSQIRHFQRIGRGMRPKGEGKENRVFIVDFADLTNRYLAKHSLARIKIIRDEPAFQLVGTFDPFF